MCLSKFYKELLTNVFLPLDRCLLGAALSFSTPKSVAGMSLTTNTTQRHHQ
jgi:hypothetical protein